MRRFAVVAAIIAAFFAVGAASAPANTPITSFSAVPSTTQAGGHPDVEVRFEIQNRLVQQSKSACNCEDAKDATVHLPAGFVGNPHATPQCSIADFSADSCPVDSQIGIVNVNASAGSFNTILYNLIPPPEVAGLLGFKVFLFNTPQLTVLSARTGSDFGLDATAISIYHGTFPLQGFQQVLWGVPADPKHDLLRLNVKDSNIGKSWYGDSLCDANGAASTSDPNTIVKPCGLPKPPVSSNSPLTPFLQNPGNCDATLSSSLEILSYDGGTSEAESAWPQPTGCDQISFNPSLYAQPTTNETDTASGIDVNLNVPQQLSPTIPSPTELRGAIVTLPAGFSINPNAADGKTSCADADANFGTELAANCPEFSKVGSLEIDSSALPGPLPGFVYLGQPLPGNRYRIFLVADGFATHLKLAGTVTPDPQTGQLTITFEDLPQSPLTAFDMHFFGSERGLLATPTQCGSYAVKTTFTPWDSSLGTQTSTQFFTLDAGPVGSPCPGAQRPFSPGFQAAVAGNTAGAHSPFSIELTRNDGDQNLSAVDISTPPGFSATLAGIPYCPESALAAAANPSYAGLAEQAAPSCPAASQIGTAVAGAGAGTHPLYVPGTVYLAGPYKGAPLSLAVITPAVSGPYDLGNAVVRVAVHVDPADAHITAISDPLPSILDGIPLRLRQLRVNLDRPNFALNPTNCGQFSVGATVFGDQGARASLAEPFQVANCAALGFAPKLSLSLSGGVNRRGHPAIRAAFSQQPGESNSHIVQVALPKGELLDNAHIGTVCTRPDFAADRCPAGSNIGTAQATTPLLGQPLKGNVYLRSNPTGTLPNLVVDLEGQFEIELVGRIDSTKGGGLRTTFETVPDAPVSTFVLNLKGGAKGLLQNSSSLCGKPKMATTRLVGQNGAVVNEKTKLEAACGTKKRHRRHAQAGGS